MTVIMRPIEVKCHSFITAIAKPPYYIDNKPPKRHNGFRFGLQQGGHVCLAKQHHFCSQICLNKDFSSQRKETALSLSPNMASMTSAISF